MKVYADASVILRLILGEPDPVPGWRGFERVITSALAQVESLRVLDRLRHTGRFSIERFEILRDKVVEIFGDAEMVALEGPILRRASEPFPAPLGTLDAIHLATALQWREIQGEDLTVSTHDRELAQAARLMGFPVVGV